MRPEETLALFDYNDWANERILDTAGRIPEEQFAAPADLSHGSLRDTLVHIYGTEWTWRMRCQEGVSPSALPSGADFPSLAALRSAWQEETEKWFSFLKILTEEDLERTVTYSNTKGVSFSNVLWQLIFHVVNHGTQFRSEAAVLLTRVGTSPGDLDFILYLRSYPDRWLQR